jgi:hypothetical protein
LIISQTGLRLLENSQSRSLPRDGVYDDAGHLLKPRARSNLLRLKKFPFRRRRKLVVVQLHFGEKLAPPTAFQLKRQRHSKSVIPVISDSSVDRAAAKLPAKGGQAPFAAQNHRWRLSRIYWKGLMFDGCPKESRCGVIPDFALKGPRKDRRGTRDLRTQLHARDLAFDLRS